MKINEFFTRGVYINLDERLDRKLEFLNEMRNVGLENFFGRVSGVLAVDKGYEFPCRAGHIACGTAHRNIIQYAKDLDLDNVLILEDDAMFYGKGINAIEQALDELQYFDDWDIIYLGGIIIDEKLNMVSEHLLSPRTVLTGHAYGVNKRAYDRFLKYNPETDSALDGWLGNQCLDSQELGTLFKKCVVYPLGMVQRTSMSNIDIQQGKYTNGTGLFPYLHSFTKEIIRNF